MSGYVLKAAVRGALSAKLAAIPAGSGAAWLCELRTELRRRHWPADAGASDAPLPDGPLPGADALRDQLTQLPREQRAEIISGLLESEAVTGDDAATSACRILTGAGHLRVRAERTIPPDFPFHPDELQDLDRYCTPHELMILDGSIWAYDLDSIVHITEAGRPRFGYSRILQIAPSANSGLAPLPAAARVVKPPPQWAEPLCSWCYEWSRRKPAHEIPRAVHRFRADCDGNRMQRFWREHECRVWQFDEPRSWSRPAEGLPQLSEVHDELTGSGMEYHTVFSTSLRVSAWTALGLGDSLSCLYEGGDEKERKRVNELYESGTYGYGEGGWHAKLRALLPFYEPMRHAQRDRGTVQSAG